MQKDKKHKYEKGIGVDNAIDVRKTECRFSLLYKYPTVEISDKILHDGLLSPEY